MQSQSQHTLFDGGVEHLDTARPGRVHDDLSGPETPGRGQSADQPGQHVVRDGEHDEIGPGHDLVRGQQGHVR